jgi:hypothetical protein
MRRIPLGRPVSALAAAAALALVAGCGSDPSGETTAPQVSLAPPTSPIATAPTTATGQAKKKATPTTATAAPAACEIPDTYQDFKFSGLDCTEALGVATAWDQNGKDCNTVDNPNSPDGYNRTCSVNGYTCTAKRDVHSDGRFVSCTQGGQSVRFTWFPV